MQAISIGHAGILVRTRGITIVCDPWFEPAFFASWFVFPRNDTLPDDVMHDVCNPDFLYVSHLHGDHFDTPFLRDRMNKDTTVILPGFPTREMERTFSRLGFRKFVRTADGAETEIADGVRVAVHVETSITDGPGGDSALVVSDGTSRLVNQNDCRTNDLSALRAHGPVDLHWLQFSGAIWYPMVYEMDETEKKQLCVDKVESQFSRAMRYVESIDATTVVPSAGPPCFLDEDLFGLNMITGDETSIFPDQREFIRRLADAGRPNASLTVPGTSFTVVADPHGGPGVVTVEQPQGAASPAAIFADKAAYLRAYQVDKAGVIAAA
ncbi:MAG: MBL fold metallo-hydrolase, partial [Actinobacteria bacterium]|nr:MBL fold metallo-hydrolase [Actinomycetota bacterium]